MDNYRAIILALCAAIPDFHPVIPAKAGIHRVADDVSLPTRASTAASAQCQHIFIQGWFGFPGSGGTPAKPR